VRRWLDQNAGGLKDDARRELESELWDGEAVAEAAAWAGKILDLECTAEQLLRECRYPVSACILAGIVAERLRRWLSCPGGTAGTYRPGSVREWTPQDRP
jgi:hypothetical protein